MKHPLYLILLLSICIIPACKKSALPVAAGNTLNKTVTTISGTSILSVDSFVYDGQQRLVEVIFSGANPPFNTSFADTVTFQYDASGRALSWTLTTGGVGRVVNYELLYDGNGRLVKELAVPVQTNIEFSDYSFAYNAQGQLVTDTVYAQHLAGIPSAGIMSYDDWTYDENGNAIADQYFSSSNTNLIGAPYSAGFTTRYRYDNQVNPYYHAGIPFFCNTFGGAQLLSPNNLVGGTPSGTSTGSPYTFSYAYFSNGRPRVQTAAVAGASGSVTQTTDYFYQ
jgi:YD repeat-containing protein